MFGSRALIRWREWLYAPASVSLVVGLGFAISAFSTTPNMAVMFLAAVFVGAALFGVRAGIATALLAFPAWNFFFIEPLYTFAVGSLNELLTLCIFLVIATVTGLLAGRVRDQALAAQSRVAALQILFDFSRKLGAAATPDALFHAIVLQAHRLTRRPAMALLPGSTGLEIRYAWPPESRLDQGAMEAARWCLANGAPAGRGTSTSATSEWHFRPVRTPTKTVGVVGLRSSVQDRDVTPELTNTLDSMLDQSAIAIERLTFAAEAARVEAMAETDRLRTALMSSVSHDLRTPLTTILGSASALLQGRDRLSPEARNELLVAIDEETRRLDQYITNLLNMSRLEAGELKPKRDWLDPGEVLEAAVARVASRARDKPLEAKIESGVPLLRADFLLLETVLVNLLDNAIKHAEGATHIVAAVARKAQTIMFEVTDDGAGIPPGVTDRLFDRFFSVQRGDSKPAGSGLGLSICKGFVEAMGGTITVRSPCTDNRGAAFSLTFPLEAQPDNSLPDTSRP